MPSGVRPDREVAAARAGGGFSGGRGSVGGGMSSADQRHRNRAAEIARVGALTGRSTRPSGNTGVSPAGRVSSAALGMSRDYRNVGNTGVENFGNRLASLLGFNEQRPSLQAAAARVDQTPAGVPTDTRANWGFDPAGLIGGAVGAGFGVPFTGFAADYLSKLAGRPLEIGMGPSVFGGGPSMPGAGPTPGGGMAYRGGNGRDRQVASPGLASPMPSPVSVNPAATGLQWKPRTYGPVTLGVNAPGLADYSLPLNPWRYFA